MGKIIYLLVLSFFVVSNTFSQQDSSTKHVVLHWESSYFNALKKSKKEKKPVLIYFTGSDWCGPCKKLDKDFFHTEQFKKYADKNLILYMADIPQNKDLITGDQQKTNDRLRKKFKQKAFPTLVLVNYKEKKLGEKTGLILPEYYYPFIQSIVDKF